MPTARFVLNANARGGGRSIPSPIGGSSIDSQEEIRMDKFGGKKTCRLALLLRRAPGLSPFMSNTVMQDQCDMVVHNGSLGSRAGSDGNNAFEVNVPAFNE